MQSQMAAIFVLQIEKLFCNIRLDEFDCSLSEYLELYTYLFASYYCFDLITVNEILNLYLKSIFLR